MIFRQLFDSVSGTYSYLIASRRGAEALIIDPVLEKVDRYVQLLGELDLRLVKAVDTHLHADHITGLGALRDRTHCITVMGEQSSVDVHPGEVTTVMYQVSNEQGRPVEAQAIPSYAPKQATEYFKKIECFCFTQQTLTANQTKRLPVVFVVDPKLPKDVKTITLSYTFFELNTPAAATAGSVAPTANTAATTANPT